MDGRREKQDLPLEVLLLAQQEEVVELVAGRWVVLAKELRHSSCCSAKVVPSTSHLPPM